MNPEIIVECYLIFCCGSLRNSFGDIVRWLFWVISWEMEFDGTKSLVFNLCLYRFCYLYPTGVSLFLKFTLHYVVGARSQEQHNNSLPVNRFATPYARTLKIVLPLLHRL